MRMKLCNIVLSRIDRMMDMKQKQSRFIALLTSIGAPVVGSSGGACGVACFAGGCCGGPAFFGLLGLSGSTLASMEKLTPLFLVVTIASLGYGFYNAYKPKPADCCAPLAGSNAASCCVKEQKQPFLQSKTFLWVVTIFCVVMWGYPLLSGSSQTIQGGKHRTGGTQILSDSANVEDGQAAGAKTDACCPSESDCETECEE